METQPLVIGTVLKSRYRVTRLVAGGGMAWVYEVADELPGATQSIWAMKELRADADDTHTLAEGRQLFRQEAEILVRLRHHNLPQVCAYFEQDGRSYLVMEFIFGESLQKRLEQANAPMLQAQVIDWAVQICDVLTYLHTQPQPVIFRDMKPSNVMVTLQSQIKLIDFGIARTYKVGKRRDTITMGSENYAAPEQWGKAQTDARADIYGLGATLYHLLTHVPPLPAFVPGQRVPMQQYNPGVSEQMASIVERAMAPDRQNRYASAQAMRDDLLSAAPRRDRRRLESYAVVPAQIAAPLAAEQTLSAVPSIIPAARPRLPKSFTKACPTCGFRNREVARFCAQCGHSFLAPQPPVVALIAPAGAHWEYPLTAADVLIGRPGGALPVALDMAFYDPEGYISRNHARISSQAAGHAITDLGSANGTQVNGTSLVPNLPQLLQHGDQICLGRVILQYQTRS
jgi:predicted Ser/Thr protein kinase